MTQETIIVNRKQSELNDNNDQIIKTKVENVEKEKITNEVESKSHMINLTQSYQSLNINGVSDPIKRDY